MPIAKHEAAYADVRAVIETAVRHESWPATVTCATPKAATTWRARAHAFRTFLRSREEALHTLPPGTGTCIYDNLVFTLDGHQVIISIRDTGVRLEINGAEVEVVAENELADEFGDDFDAEEAV